MRREVSVLLSAVAGTVALAAFWLPALAQLPGELERIEFTLADSSCHIMMPQGSKLRHAPGCVQIWHPQSTRLVKFLQLCAQGAPAAAPNEAILRNGARIAYSLDYDIGGGSGGGSGGSEAELKGSLELNGRMLALTCRDQGEWGTAPNWCLAYLHSLVIADRN